MPRPSGKAQKIAYAVLGEPAPLKAIKKGKQRKIDDILEAQETRLIKGVSEWPRRA